jgi:flagellar basal-body rod protein FlgF
LDSPGYIVLSRLVAQARANAVTANNIANADTPAFRGARPVFSTVLEQQRGAALPPGGREVSFTQDRATWRDDRAGPLATTGNPLDIAISAPEGYFVIDTPRGERFTRAGRFVLDGQGQVVDQDGNAVQGANGRPLRLGPGDSRIDVLADGTLRTENGDAGQFRIVRFDDTQRLVAEGDRLLSAPETMQPRRVDAPGLVQGAVEGSNVRPIVELTRMTEELREFQFVTQMAEKEGERLGSAVERILKRR